MTRSQKPQNSHFIAAKCKWAHDFYCFFWLAYYTYRDTFLLDSRGKSLEFHGTVHFFACPLARNGMFIDKQPSEHQIPMKKSQHDSLILDSPVKEGRGSSWGCMT